MSKEKCGNDEASMQNFKTELPLTWCSWQPIVITVPLKTYMWFLHLCIQAEFSRRENLHSYSSCTHCSCLKLHHLLEHHGGFHFVVVEIYFLLQLAVSADGGLLAYLLFLCSQHVYSINVERSLLSPSAIMEEKHFLFCVVVVCGFLFFGFFLRMPTATIPCTTLC